MTTAMIVENVTSALTDPYQVILMTPAILDRQNPEAKNRVPITCHISQNGSEDPLGCMIYSIPDVRRKQVYQTILNNAEEDLLDVTKRISRLITNKYNVSSYVSISGRPSPEDSVIYLQKVIELIEKQFGRLS